MINRKVVLLSIAVVFFIIGVHQSFYFGIQASYWAFMIAGLSFLWMQYIKKPEEMAEDDNSKSTTHKDSSQKSRKNKRK
jgi:O-antigen ligase